MRILGAAALDGEFTVEFDGFTPSVGDQLDVVAYGSHVGEFAQVNAANLPKGLALNPNYQTTVLTVGVVAALRFAEQTDAASSRLPKARLEDVRFHFEVAVDRWKEAGLLAAFDAVISNIDIHVADLPDGYLAFASRDAIWIDRDAGGFGWFVDPTPWDNDEFYLNVAKGQMQARPDEASTDEVMHFQLPRGVRRIPYAAGIE